MGKVMTMKEAISRHVKSGDLLFIGGMQHGEPFAAVMEILRQRIDHLKTAACLVTSLSLLIGEGRVDRVYTGYYGQDANRSYWLSRAKAGQVSRFRGVLPLRHRSGPHGRPDGHPVPAGPEPGWLRHAEVQSQHQDHR